MPHAQDFMNLPKPVVPKTENRNYSKGRKQLLPARVRELVVPFALALGHARSERLY